MKKIRKLTLRRSALYFLSLLLVLLPNFLMAETASRLYWGHFHDVPFWKPDKVLYSFYSDLENADSLSITQNDDFFDVLLLGGSVMDPQWGDIGAEMRRLFQEKGINKVRITNFARPGHTSKDSLIKYSSLIGLNFDLVIFYHGINEVRANNAPPEIFREDYSHYSWYEKVEMLTNYHGRTTFALPYTLRYLFISAYQYFNEEKYLPTHAVKEDWFPYGSTTRTGKSFRNNLISIVEIANDRQEKILLLSFLIYIPKNYSRKSFREKSLNYDKHIAPIEIWGTPVNVLKSVNHHNEIVRQVASRRKTLFVDLEKKFEGGRRYFNDVCHLNKKGSVKFAEAVVESLYPDLQDGEEKSREKLEL